MNFCESFTHGMPVTASQRENEEERELNTPGRQFHDLQNQYSL